MSSYIHGPHLFFVSVMLFHFTFAIVADLNFSDILDSSVAPLLLPRQIIKLSYWTKDELCLYIRVGQYWLSNTDTFSRHLELLCKSGDGWSVTISSRTHANFQLKWKNRVHLLIFFSIF